MKLLWNDKDGGPESKGWLWGIESKRFGSVLLILFREGTREAYHSHAFNALSWVLTGGLREEILAGVTRYHFPSWRPVRTGRLTFHQVKGLFKRSWAISVRGPWADQWNEYIPGRGRITLTHGRKEVA